jgi:transposase
MANTPKDSPSVMEHIPEKHWTTPQKQRIHDINEFGDSLKIHTPTGTRVTKTRLFRQQGVPRSSAYRFLKTPDPRRLENSGIRKETRGRKSILSPQDIRAIERLIWTNGYDGRVLSWESLKFEAAVNASAHTIQRYFLTMGYRRCVACRKGFISDAIAAKRVKFATDMLTKYPNPEDWRHVRFSDEVHLGYGSEGRVYVTRRADEVNCPDCVQHEREAKKKDEKKVHGWAAIGYNFKSTFYQYDAGNSNGAITQKVYLEILKAEVMNWPSSVVLEQDGASGHGKGKNSPISRWLQANNHPYYFNCPYSPDLAPIENTWVAPKAWLRKFAHWDTDTVWELAQEGWEALTQEKINMWCDSMPERLRNVIALNGQITAW